MQACELPPLPRDWSRKRILLLGAAGHLCLLPVAVRHVFFWGGGASFLGVELAQWLHFLEATGLIAFVLLAGASFSAALRQAPSLPLRWLLGAGCLLAFLAVLPMPFLSQDAYDNAARGMVETLAGENPYLVSAAEAGDHPALVEARELARWDRSRQPYGPLTSLVQAAVCLFGNAWAAVYAMKLLFCAALVGTAWCVYKSLQPRGEPMARQGLVLLLWNPWLLLEFGGSGHNDSLMALLLAAAALCAARDRIALSTFAFGLAVLAKHGCAPVGPLLLAWAWHKKRLPAFGFGVLATGLVATPLALRYFTEPGALDALLAQANVAGASPTSLVGDLVAPWAGTAARVLGAVLVLWLIARSLPAVRTPAALGHRSVLVLVLLLFAFLANFAPWYHLWWLALLGLCTAPILVRVGELLAYLAPFTYLVYLATREYGFVHELWRFTLGLLWPALLIFLERRQLLGEAKATHRRLRRRRPEAGD